MNLLPPVADMYVIVTLLKMRPAYSKPVTCKICLFKISLDFWHMLHVIHYYHMIDYLEAHLFDLASFRITQIVKANKISVLTTTSLLHCNTVGPALSQN